MAIRTGDEIAPQPGVGGVHTRTGSLHDKVLQTPTHCWNPCAEQHGAQRAAASHSGADVHRNGSLTFRRSLPRGKDSALAAKGDESAGDRNPSCRREWRHGVRLVCLSFLRISTTSRGRRRVFHFPDHEALRSLETRTNIFSKKTLETVSRRVSWWRCLCDIRGRGQYHQK